MLYVSVIIGSAIIIIIANTVFSFSPELLLSNTLSVSLGVIAIIAQDGIGALLLRRLTPAKWYAPGRKFFRVTKKERDIYHKLKIKKWKDYVPELGIFTGFSKSEIKDADDPSYLGKFLVESNYGVVIHIVNAITGFVIMFIPCCSSSSIWIPIFAVNFVLCLLPVAVLRYTSHTLLKLYERTQKHK